MPAGQASTGIAASVLGTSDAVLGLVKGEAMGLVERSEGPVLLRMHGQGVAVATLDRPAKLNALDGDLLEALGSIIREVSTDGDVRALVLASSGPRAFCAGADVRWLGAAADEAERAARSAVGHATFDALAACQKPTIAAIEGLALGGGCELALACDIRVASRTARFGQPEVALGLFPGWGGTQRLARLVGASVALEMILSGAPVEAERALAIGLATRLEAAGQALEVALDLASAIAARPAGVVALARSLVRDGLASDLATGLARERAAFAGALASPDAREGIAAFIEKRAPRFAG